MKDWKAPLHIIKIHMRFCVRVINIKGRVRLSIL